MTAQEIKERADQIAKDNGLTKTAKNNLAEYHHYTVDGNNDLAVSLYTTKGNYYVSHAWTDKKRGYTCRYYTPHNALASFKMACESIMD